MEKIKMVAVSDWADTGFGRVMKELLPRLARTGRFEIHVVGWCYTGMDPRVYDDAKAVGITLYPSIMGDWGERMVKKVIGQVKPHVIFSLGDPWMVDWIGDLPIKGKVPWVAYVPIDRDPVSASWRKTLSAGRREDHAVPTPRGRASRRRPGVVQAVEPRGSPGQP